MASIQQRGASWRVQVLKAGKRVSSTFDTLKEAEDWARKTEGELAAGAIVQPVELRKGVTVEQLFSRYAATESPKKRGARWEQIRLKMLARDFELFRRPVDQFTPAALVEWRDARLGQVSAYSVNRELNLISAVCNVARKEWQITALAANPVHSVTRPANPRARKQRVSPEQRAALIAALGWDGASQPANASQWVAFAFSLALETAMRKSEILAITWQHVHIDQRFIHLPSTKNGDERNVPLSSGALALLRLLKPGGDTARMIRIHSGHLDKLMREARQDTGLMAVRFHDSRREAATVFSKKLSNVLELSAVTGHKSLQVLKGYYAPTADYLADKLG
jgi:integrase